MRTNTINNQTVSFHFQHSPFHNNQHINSRTTINNHKRSHPSSNHLINKSNHHNTAIIDSATTPSSINRCSTCQINLTTQYFKPLIAQPQKFDKTCPHRYCSTCFNTLTTTSNNNQCSWDGYPMVDKMYRKRHDIDQIYTCQLCQLYQFESTS